MQSIREWFSYNLNKRKRDWPSDTKSAISAKATIQERPPVSIFAQALSAFPPDVRSPVVAVSCWMPEASTRVPPELSCQTEGKNRCRPREIIVFLDVNRIGPKNPYRGKIFARAVFHESHERIAFITNDRALCVLSLVARAMNFQPFLPGICIAIDDLPRRRCLPSGRRVARKRGGNAFRAACSLVFLSSSRFGDWTDLALLRGGELHKAGTVCNCVIRYPEWTMKHQLSPHANYGRSWRLRGCLRSRGQFCVGSHVCRGILQTGGCCWWWRGTIASFVQTCRGWLETCICIICTVGSDISWRSDFDRAHATKPSIYLRIDFEVFHSQKYKMIDWIIG